MKSIAVFMLLAGSMGLYAGTTGCQFSYSVVSEENPQDSYLIRGFANIDEKDDSILSDFLVSVDHEVTQMQKAVTKKSKNNEAAKQFPNDLVNLINKDHFFPKAWLKKLKIMSVADSNIRYDMGDCSNNGCPASVFKYFDKNGNEVGKIFYSYLPGVCE